MRPLLHYGSYALTTTPPSHTVLVVAVVQGAHPAMGPDLAMDGLGAPPPIDQNLGLVVAARSSLPQTWGLPGQVFIYILNFSPFFMKMVKKLSALGGLRPMTPHQGLSVPGPCWGPPQTPV